MTARARPSAGEEGRSAMARPAQSLPTDLPVVEQGGSLNRPWKSPAAATKGLSENYIGRVHLISVPRHGLSHSPPFVTLMDKSRVLLTIGLPLPDMCTGGMMGVCDSSLLLVSATALRS